MAKGLEDRAKANRDARRDALREELKSREYIRQIHRILDREYEDELSVKAAKMKMDGYFKLLAKTLPDLKAIEVSGDGDQPLTVQIIQFGDDTTTE